MGTTTFDGPIKAGTIFNTTGTTVGTNVSNVGYGVCVQSDTIDEGDTSAKDLSIYLPENSQILAIEVLVEIPFLEDDTFDCGVTGGDGNLLIDGYGAEDVDMEGRIYKPLFGSDAVGATAAAASEGNWITGKNPFMNTANWYNITTTSGISGDVRLNAKYIPDDADAESAELRLNVMYIPGRNASAPAAWSV